MFILLGGILVLVAAIAFFYYWWQIKDDKEIYYRETDSYPLYHWKFIFYRYKVAYVSAITFTLFTLGIAMIIVFIS